MLAVTREQIRSLDEWAERELGLKKLILMENAGRSVFQHISTALPRTKRVVVISGKGNNGGDGFVVARHLASSGIPVSILLISRRSEISGDSMANLNIAEKMGVPIHEATDEASLQTIKSSIKNADVVVDAIFGVGLSGRVEGHIAKVIDLINTVKSTDKKNYSVISVDLPSGLDADTGEGADLCVKADMTVTFTYPKIGLLKYPAIDVVGKLIISDIGIPQANPLSGTTGPSIAEKRTGKTEAFNIITSEFVKTALPKRVQSSHKGTAGQVLVIGGSRGMPGAPAMSARAALRVGAGLVKVALPEGIAQVVNSLCQEAITVPLTETRNGTLSLKALGSIMELFRSSDAVVIGPGISTDKETVELVKRLIAEFGREKNKCPIVIDADALNALSENVFLLKGLQANIILTPHPGEMSRLTKDPVEKVLERRNEIIKSFAKENNVVIVLKGARSLVSDGTEVLLNLTGNPSMATAGMGDVLTGAISGLAAQGMSAFDASASGVYIHGMAGDVISSMKGDRGIIATDIIEALPYVIRSI